MKQIPFWEADSSSVSRENPSILWNPKVQSLVHNNPPPTRILSQINPVHATPPYYLKNHCCLRLLNRKLTHI
jgi:hypothetical protein